MTEQNTLLPSTKVRQARAVILDHDANIVSVAQREFTQIYPQAGC